MSERRKKFQAIKGVRDILPPDTALWNRVEQIARQVFETYGFQEIRLPIFEETELFARSLGVDTDIVTKEMYTFQDRDEASVTLRPEATASVVRAYIQHGMHTWPGNVKLYYLGPMFRRERPQKGRYRQFQQIGAEVLGPSDDPSIDAEVVEMLMAYFERLGLRGSALYVNSIGCKECRPLYVAQLRAELTKVKNKLGPDSQRRIETNPLRVLDSKLDREQAIIELMLPRMGDHLCATCREHFAELQAQLKLRGIRYQINWRLVRGLDYYMRTTFEVTAPGLGAQNAICGGGRYDGLVELLGGPPTKGIGFAIGTDRVVLAIQGVQEGAARSPGEAQRPISKEQPLQVVDFVVVGTSDTTWPKAVKIAQSLRKMGLRVHLPEPKTRLGKALDFANKLGAKATIIVGEDELKIGNYRLRVMKPFAAGEPQDVNLETTRIEQYGMVARLGAELEQKLEDLLRGEAYFSKDVGLAGMLFYLKERRVYSRDVLDRLERFVKVRNQVLHGNLGDEEEFKQAVTDGSVLLAELGTLSRLE